jgi:hypothetical protein
MVQYKAIDSSAEVKGSAILATLESLNPKVLRPILVENGLGDQIDAGAWYLQQKWLDVLRIIDERQLGGDLDLVAIGTRIPYTADWPPNVKSTEEALFSIDIAYHLNHRRGEVGHYRAEKIDPCLIDVICDNPYPCYFDYGIVYGTAQKFHAANKTFTVVHNDGTCRRRGDNVCVYHVSCLDR